MNDIVTVNISCRPLTVAGIDMNFYLKPISKNTSKNLFNKLEEEIRTVVWNIYGDSIIDEGRR